MPQTPRFCPGCNQKFSVGEDDASCPVCGQELSPLAAAPTAEVLLTANAPCPRPAASGDAGAGAREADEALVGQEIGLYRIERFLGRGGMARVYQGTHRMLERPCAVKVLDPELARRDPEYVAMFLDEARAAAALVHPHVVTVHNIGLDSGWHFIEMEYVAGDSLQRLVSTSGRLSPVRATELMVETCSGLAEAHRRGIIHRDFKPANVLVDQRGRAKLADFGLAKRIHARESALREGVMVGTPYYMAPELFHRRPASQQSDVYAAGVTFYYLLTGELPFVDASLTDLARKHAEGGLPGDQRPAVEVPDEALAVVHKCLAKNADARYADGVELEEALRAVYGGLRSLASLLREALSGLDTHWRGADDSFVVEVGIAGGRSQRVRVEATAAGRIVDRLIKVFSVCAPLKESYFRRALELNAEITHGSIAIEEIDGVPYFVMGNTYPRSSCDPLEIRKSVLEIARWADYVEKMLTGRDRN